MHDAEGEATNLTALGCCESLTLQLHGGLRAEFTIKTYIQLRRLRKTLNAGTKPAGSTIKSRDVGKVRVHFKGTTPCSTLPTMPLVEGKPFRARCRY